MTQQNPNFVRPGEGTASMEGQLQSGYQQRQNAPQLTPDQMALANLALDPAEAQRMLQLRYGGGGVQQQQQPTDPDAALQGEIAQLQQLVDGEYAKPHDQRDYPLLMEKQNQLQQKKIDLGEQQRNRQMMQYQQERIQEGNQRVWERFITTEIGRLKLDEAGKHNMGSEFFAWIQSSRSLPPINSPQDLENALPTVWNAFRYQRGIQPDGTVRGAEQPAYMRGNEAYNSDAQTRPNSMPGINVAQPGVQPQSAWQQQPGMQAQPANPNAYQQNYQTQGQYGQQGELSPSDMQKLQQAASMSNVERRVYKEALYNQGLRHVADRINNVDGSPITPNGVQ